MTLPPPSNGKYFNKEEVVSRITSNLTGPERESALATVQVLFDHIEHAPIDVLMFLVGNRLSMVNGQHVACDIPVNLVMNIDGMMSTALVIALQHRATCQKE